MKKGVKKNKASESAYAARKQREKEVWTLKVFAYTQQEMLDAVALTLADEFGFGQERQKRFHDAFERKYAEIQELERSDTADSEYAIAKQEAALKAAYGKYYMSREQRYNIVIVDSKGGEHKFA